MSGSYGKSIKQLCEKLPTILCRAANPFGPEQSQFQEHEMLEAKCVNKLTSSSAAYQQASGPSVFPVVINHRSYCAENVPLSVFSAKH